MDKNLGRRASDRGPFSGFSDAAVLAWVEMMRRGERKAKKLSVWRTLISRWELPGTIRGEKRK